MRSILCIWILILPPRVPSSATERNNYSVKYILDWERTDILAAAGERYPLDNSIGFASVYPLDSDLSSGQCYPSFEQLGPDRYPLLLAIGS